MRASFLSGISKYLPLIDNKEPQNKSNENKSIIQFYFIKLSVMLLDNSPRISAVSSRIKDEGESIINAKSKVVKRIKTTENNLLKQFNIDTKQNYSFDQLIKVFNKVIEMLYSFADTHIRGLKRPVKKKKKLNLLKDYHILDLQQSLSI